ncbi:unnamed protein product, partial [Mesorhabditis spiculigera]
MQIDDVYAPEIVWPFLESLTPEDMAEFTHLYVTVDPNEPDAGIKILIRTPRDEIPGWASVHQPLPGNHPTAQFVRDKDTIEDEIWEYYQEHKVTLRGNAYPDLINDICDITAARGMPINWLKVKSDMAVVLNRRLHDPAIGAEPFRSFKPYFEGSPRKNAYRRRVRARSRLVFPGIDFAARDGPTEALVHHRGSEQPRCRDQIAVRKCVADDARMERGKTSRCPDAIRPQSVRSGAIRHHGIISLSYNTYIDRGSLQARIKVNPRGGACPALINDFYEAIASRGWHT